MVYYRDVTKRVEALQCALYDISRGAILKIINKFAMNSEFYFINNVLIDENKKNRKKLLKIGTRIINGRD